MVCDLYSRNLEVAGRCSSPQNRVLSFVTNRKSSLQGFKLGRTHKMARDLHDQLLTWLIPEAGPAIEKVGEFIRAHTSA